MGVMILFALLLVTTVQGTLGRGLRVSHPSAPSTALISPAPKSDFLPSGCQATSPKYWKATADIYTLTLGMTLSRCFNHCRGHEGSKYFAITKGKHCICTEIPPGQFIADHECYQKCSGNPAEVCGGVANAASVFTMMDCDTTLSQKRQRVSASREEQLKQAYNIREGEGCSGSTKDLTQLNGSSNMAGTADQCKLACWLASGAEVCHGFTYDRTRSKCTFYTDCGNYQSGKHTSNSGLTCYFKNPMYRFDWDRIM